jgi:hypothetical protein
LADEICFVIRAPNVCVVYQFVRDEKIFKVFFFFLGKGQYYFNIMMFYV